MLSKAIRTLNIAMVSVVLEHKYARNRNMDNLCETSVIKCSFCARECNSEDPRIWNW